MRSLKVARTSSQRQYVPNRPRSPFTHHFLSDSESSNTTSSDNSSHEQEFHEVQSTLGLTVSDPDVLDCPICTNPLTIPVYQCEDGHFTCSLCRDMIEDKCPSCRKTIGYKRCRGMENVLESIKTTCQNMEYGCTVKVSYCKKLDHENSCKYTPIPCLAFLCNYIGVAKSFYRHYVENHPDSFKLITFDNVNSIDVGEEPYLLFAEKEKTLFFLNRVIDPLGSFVNVSTVSKKKFSYEITAGSGEKSINMKSVVEIAPKLFAKPAKEKCLLITNSIRGEASCVDSKLPLNLVIHKGSL